jgi:hypothetical protein
MKRQLKSGHARLKTKLGLPDLEHAKIAVIVSLRSFESQRSYRHSIDEFVAWYCSAPRLSFNDPARIPSINRSCMERFIERSACRFIEAIEFAWCQ